MPLSARCNIPMMCVGRGSTPPYEGIARIAAHYQAGRCGHCPLRKSCRAWPVCLAVGLRRSIGGGTHGCRPAESCNSLCRGGVLPRPPLRCKLQKQAGQSRRPAKDRRRRTMRRTRKILSLRTSPQAGVAIRNPPPARFRVWQRVGFAAFLLPFRKKGVRSHCASDSLFFMDLIEITADSSAGQRRYRRYTRRSDSGCRS